MNAKYFYEKLLESRKEAMKTYHLHSDICGTGIDIRHSNDNDRYYTIFLNGMVIEKTSTGIRKSISFDELTGDDFELYSPVQIFKVGYLVIPDANSEKYIKEVITAIYNKIDNGDIIEEHAVKPYICGETILKNELVEKFTYNATNGMEITLSTVRDICKENMFRKQYGHKNCFPFIKRIKNEEAIYVYFSDIVSKDTTFQVENKLCNEALKELIHYCEIENASWINWKINKPICI